MRFTALVALLFPSAILAVPYALAIRAGDELCAPTTYTISNYTLAVSASSAHVNFAFKSTFLDRAIIQDSVIDGASCVADGPTIPNNNECHVADRKLLFDLRAPQEQAYYQITHTWACNGTTWISGNAVRISPLNCDEKEDSGMRTCSSSSQIFAPQNVRKVCSSPTC